jgi:hypothetical protein
MGLSPLTWRRRVIQFLKHCVFYLEFRTMEKFHKPSHSECYTVSSEPFRNYTLSYWSEWNYWYKSCCMDTANYWSSRKLSGPLFSEVSYTAYIRHTSNFSFHYARSSVLYVFYSPAMHCPGSPHSQVRNLYDKPFIWLSFIFHLRPLLDGLS